MGWRRDSGRGLPCERGNLFQKEGGLPLFRARCQPYPYTMSLLCMPRVVRLRLEKIQRDFLWVEGKLEKKPHLVKWLIVCSDKRKGC